MKRKVWLTAQHLADNRRLRPSPIPKSGHRIQFRRQSRGQIISQQRHDDQPRPTPITDTTIFLRTIAQAAHRYCS
jgi:hypothetical protein